MNKNLNQKLALIFVVLLVFIYGIFGVPSGVTGKSIMDAMSKRIHLGLDLRGGVHLILKVNVERFRELTPQPELNLTPPAGEPPPK